VDASNKAAGTMPEMAGKLAGHCQSHLGTIQHTACLEAGRSQHHPISEVIFTEGRSTTYQVPVLAM